MIRISTETWRLASLTVCLAGVTFAYSMQIAFMTPFFKELAISNSFVGLIWVGGPLAGLLVQPIVGVLSDRCKSRYGRRRPYILAGALTVVACEQLVANAHDISSILPDRAASHTMAVAVSVFGFWLMDIANNCIQGPVRALLADFPELSQSRGSAFFSFWVAVGNISGYGVGSIKWSTLLPFFRSAPCQTGCADLRSAYIIGGSVLLILTLVTIAKTREKPITEPPNDGKKNLFITIFNGVIHQPRWFLWLNLVQFAAWIGWFCVFMFATDYMGINIFHGTPSDICPPTPIDSPCQLYEAGVRAGSLAMAMQAAVCVVVSPILPYLMRKIGTKYVFAIGQAVFGLALMSLVLVKTVLGATLVFAVTGVGLSVIMVIPYAIIGNMCPLESTGLYMGVRNVIVCIAQLLCSVSMAPLIKVIADGDVAWSLFIGGVLACLGGVLVIKLTTGEEKEIKDTLEEPLIQ